MNRSPLRAATREARAEGARQTNRFRQREVDLLLRTERTEAHVQTIAVDLAARREAGRLGDEVEVEAPERIVEIHLGHQRRPELLRRAQHREREARVVAEDVPRAPPLPGAMGVSDLVALLVDAEPLVVRVGASGARELDAAIVQRCRLQAHACDQGDHQSEPHDHGGDRRSRGSTASRHGPWQGARCEDAGGTQAFNHAMQAFNHDEHESRQAPPSRVFRGDRGSNGAAPRPRPTRPAATGAGPRSL